MNVQIKALAQQQQVLLCDMNAEFKAQSNLTALYCDYVHPNDAGYQVMAQGWFKAITRGRAASAAPAAPGTSASRCTRRPAASRSPDSNVGASRAKPTFL